jgi:hypothetical protein
VEFKLFLDEVALFRTRIHFSIFFIFAGIGHVQPMQAYETPRAAVRALLEWYPTSKPYHDGDRAVIYVRNMDEGFLWDEVQFACAIVLDDSSKQSEMQITYWPLDKRHGNWLDKEQTLFGRFVNRDFSAPHYTFSVDRRHLPTIFGNSDKVVKSTIEFRPGVLRRGLDPFEWQAALCWESKYLCLNSNSQRSGVGINSKYRTSDTELNNIVISLFEAVIKHYSRRARDTGAITPHGLIKTNSCLKVGGLIAETVEYHWAKELVKEPNSCVALLQADGYKDPVFIIVDDRGHPRELTVRYWILPQESETHVLSNSLECGLKNHFLGFPFGQFTIPRSVVPFFRLNGRREIEFSFSRVQKNAKYPIAWVALGGEGTSMTISHEQANSEIGRMAYLLVERARCDYAKRQRCLLQIKPLWWISTLSVIVIILVVRILARNRRLLRNV